MPVITVAAAIAVGVLLMRVPLDLSPAVILTPLAFMFAGVVLFMQFWSNGFRAAFPMSIAVALLIAYGLALLVALPRLEHAKPVKHLARESPPVASNRTR